MADDSTIKTLSKLIADTCAIAVGTIKPEGKLVGYGLDSVRVLDLIMALEDEYDIEINETDPELAEIQTVAELAGLVDRRRNG